MTKKSECLLTKEEFCKYINFIKDRIEAEDKINNLFTEEFSDSIFMPYGKCIDKIVSLLSKIMRCEDIDAYGTTDIDYFIYELDFGKKWPEYSAYDEHDAPIPMRTPEELYDYLIKENFED